MTPSALADFDNYYMDRLPRVEVYKDVCSFLPSLPLLLLLLPPLLLPLYYKQPLERCRVQATSYAAAAALHTVVTVIAAGNGGVYYIRHVGYICYRLSHGEWTKISCISRWFLLGQAQW
jgi:hypothetical protein